MSTRDIQPMIFDGRELRKANKRETATIKRQTEGRDTFVELRISFFTNKKLVPFTVKEWIEFLNERHFPSRESLHNAELRVNRRKRFGLE